jgi:hypothetical protein
MTALTGASAGLGLWWGGRAASAPSLRALPQNSPTLDAAPDVYATPVFPLVTRSPLCVTGLRLARLGWGTGLRLFPDLKL